MWVGKKFIEINGFISLISDAKASFDYFHKLGCLLIVSIVVMF